MCSDREVKQIKSDLNTTLTDQFRPINANVQELQKQVKQVDASVEEIKSGQSKLTAQLQQLPGKYEETLKDQQTNVLSEVAQIESMLTRIEGIVKNLPEDYGKHLRAHQTNIINYVSQKGDMDKEIINKALSQIYQQYGQLNREVAHIESVQSEQSKLTAQREQLSRKYEETLTAQQTNVLSKVAQIESTLTRIEGIVKNLPEDHGKQLRAQQTNIIHHLSRKGETNQEITNNALSQISRQYEQLHREVAHIGDIVDHLPQDTAQLEANLTDIMQQLQRQYAANPEAQQPSFNDSPQLTMHPRGSQDSLPPAVASGDEEDVGSPVILTQTDELGNIIWSNDPEVPDRIATTRDTLPTKERLSIIIHNPNDNSRQGCLT